MSGNSRARKRNDVDANEESSSVVPRTSNMMIRTANGQAHPPRSETRQRRTPDDGGPAGSPAVPVDSPAGRQRPHSTPATADASSSQERSGRRARSRRWVQLRNTTTVTPDARGTDTAKGGHGAATDDDTKSKTGRRPATTSGKRENLRRDVRTKPVEADQRPVEVGRRPEADRTPEAARCGDPYTSLWELALLPTRMTMAATTEALTMLTSGDDGTRRSAMPWSRSSTHETHRHDQRDQQSPPGGS
jgi:hypothetical protein